MIIFRKLIKNNLKLFFIIFLNGAFFTYFLTLLLIILNPWANTNHRDFFFIFYNLSKFYLPFWFIINLLLFYMIQFVLGQSFNVRTLKIPTIAYFMAFNNIVISIIFYSNFKYYSLYFNETMKFNFIKILFVCIIISIITAFFIILGEKIIISFQYIIFFSIIIFSLIYSYKLIVNPQEDIDSFQNLKKNRITGEKRKIKVVLMNGLSELLINKISDKKNIFNFNYLINNSVRGDLITYSPNYELSLINTMLTGQKAYKFRDYSRIKYKFQWVDKEFSILPKFILFRYYAKFKQVLIYKINKYPIVDNLYKHFNAIGSQTIRVIYSDYLPPYLPQKLANNNLFVKYYSNALKSDNKFYTILKKKFYSDNFIRDKIPLDKNRKQDYSFIIFSGLEIITKYFYQYYFNTPFQSFKSDNLKEFKNVLPSYYQFYDSIIGNILTSLRKDELLLVVSFYQYKPLPVWRRFISNLVNNINRYVYVPLDSKGLIFIYSKKNTKKNYKLSNISIFDIYPTLLYYSGFKINPKLQGEVIKDAFTSDFLLDNPIEISN